MIHLCRIFSCFTRECNVWCWHINSVPISFYRRFVRHTLFLFSSTMLGSWSFSTDPISLKSSLHPLRFHWLSHIAVCLTILVFCLCQQMSVVPIKHIMRRKPVTICWTRCTLVGLMYIAQNVWPKLKSRNRRRCIEMVFMEREKRFAPCLLTVWIWTAALRSDRKISTTLISVFIFSGTDLDMKMTGRVHSIRLSPLPRWLNVTSVNW